MASSSSACCSNAVVTTRKKTEIWLVGQTLATIGKTKLPSKQEVLRLFFHYKSKGKQTIKESCRSTANDILAVWKMAGIPTQLKKHVVAKVENMFKDWQKLKKNKENKTKRSEGISQKEKEWQIKLEELFDIAHADALNMISIQEDKDFLIAQRERGRRGKIGNLDRAVLTALEKKQKWTEKQQIREKRMLEREQEDIASITNRQSIQLSSSSSDDEVNASMFPLSTTSTNDRSTTQKRGRKRLLNDNLALSLDVAKLSDRKATVVLTRTLQSVGCDPSKYNINYSSVRRQRINFRQKIATSLKSEFKADVPLTIHWDGKMIEDISGHETVDRLPIIVSGKGIDQLLAVPKLSCGTGDSAASAVYETLLSWGLCDQIKCLSFDTTATNTGPRNGACILLEQKMEKDMLWLACRHHIMEIMLEAVLLQALGPSTGPEILIFKRFKKAWNTINQTEYTTATSDAFAVKQVKNITTEIINFAQNQLTQFQPRDDYKELLKLTIIFLGGIPEKGISFRAPGGLHRARWMAKAIYSLKIYLFRDQFKLTKKEEIGIREACIFTIKIYIKYWFQAPSGSCAPRNDLQLLKDLKAYEEINEAISKVALKKILGHLWYLSEELVAFAFFDDTVPLEIKKKMLIALKNEGIDQSPVKRITLDADVINRKSLEDFVSSNTRRFFSITGISSAFLEKNVEVWDEDDDYKTSRELVCSMKVINDVAERGVALMEEYNKLHTTNEEQKQYLLLLVKQYRKIYPDSKKSTLLK